MNPAHVQRSLFSLVLVLIAAIILAGTLHASAFVSAASTETPTATATVQTKDNTTLTPTSLPTPVQASADTTGIIALAILIATTVVVGAILGQRKFRKKKAS